MMNLARKIAILFIFIIITLPVFAEGYSILVIPDYCLKTGENNYVGNMNIEELLAKKMIDRLEYTGTAYSPTLQVLKISIKNNPSVMPDKISTLENSKILSNAYGVSKVLLISSRIEMLEEAKQKSFWSKLELPVLIQSGTSERLVTNVVLYNAKTNEVLWSDVYYKGLNQVNTNGTSGEKLAFINSYYDEIIPKVFSNMRESKETHAIMVHEKTLPKIDAKTNVEPNVYGNRTIKNIFADNKKVEKENISKKDFIGAVKTSISKKKAEFKKLQQERKEKEAEKIMAELDKNKDVEKKEEVQKNKTISLHEKINNKINGFKAEKEKKSAQKNSAISFREKLKNKLSEYKNKFVSGKEKQIKSTEDYTVYSTQTKPNEENTSEAIKSLQTKPRNNARTFAPKFDSTVNDI